MISAAVFLNGEYADAAFDRRVAAAAAFVLGADGGAARLDELGLRPDAVVGDLDSLPDAVAARLAAAGVPFIRYPVHKDQTDAELAVAHAVALGAGRVVLAGALGGMLDHEFGHIAVLRGLAQNGVVAELVAPTLWATVVCAPAAIVLSGVRGRRFSLQSLTDESLVTLRGFEYELSADPVRADTCLGLGNHVTADEPFVELHAGQALLMIAADGSPSHGPERERAAVSAAAAAKDRGAAVRRWAWIAWAVFIFLVSVVPAGWLLDAAPRETWSALSSAAHFLEFMILAVLLLWVLNGREQTPGGTWGVVWRAALAAFSMALAIELVQWPIPYRSFDPLDLLADAAGILLAVAAFSVLRRRSAPRPDR